MAGRSPGHQDDIIRERTDREEDQGQVNRSDRVDGHGHDTREYDESNTNHAPPSNPQPQPQSQPQSQPQQQPKPGAVMGVVTKLGLDAPTVIAMFKGALAPIIGLAIYQSDAVAEEFSTFGYLVGIIAVLSLSALPRGKFVQTLVLNLLFLCVGAAVALLILWSALQARLHTLAVPDNPQSPPVYNSSQAAVSALWLVVNIWIVNTLRAKYPSLNIPSIVYSIMTNILCTFSTQIASNAALESIVKRLLTAMLTGFAIATATCLLVLPVPSRAVSVAQLSGLIKLLQGAVKQEKAYLQSLEREDMFAVPADICAATHLSDSGSSVDSASMEKETNKKKNRTQTQPKTTNEAKAIKETMFNLRLLTTEKRGWMTTSETPLEILAEKNEDKRVWNEVMKQLHEPFERLSDAISEGLQHSGILLEILPRPKEPKESESNANGPFMNADVESRGDLVRPGDPGFAQAFRAKIQCFRDMRGTILRAWAKEKGLMTNDASFDHINSASFSQGGTRHHHDQGQLYVLLYIETLMEAAGEGVLQFVEFADSKVADGTMACKRLIIPKPKVLRKWITSIFSEEDKHQENDADLFDTGMAVIYMGDSFALKRDPEHLPPTNFWQRVGNGLRAISKFFSSEESAFGFRCACATLTIGIIAFLEQTHVFFQEQRLVWAMIIIAIGMTQSSSPSVHLPSGQSIFGFLCRILGTLVAVVLTLITWYIVDEKVPGIFVFLYLFQAISLYFLLKFPQLIPAVVLCMVTQVLIVGYELQVLKIGVQVSESSGQPFYPIYLLAPYRLAIVAAGCLVAFFWTIFPSPVTERTWLRRDLAVTLYLLANYFSVINETLKSKLNGTGGDRNVKGTPAHQLAKHRLRLFSKLMLLLPSLKQHADFQRWEPTVGGKFPRELYEDIIQRASRINSYLTLLSYTIGGGGKGTRGMTVTDSLDASIIDPNPKSVSGNPRFEGANSRAWRDALAVLLANISPTQHSIICTLTLLSNALQSGHSIPPHLNVPRPFELTRQLEAICATITGDDGNSSSDATIKSVPGDNTSKMRHESHGLLDARNMTQAGYAEFAVLQVCSTLVCDDLEGLVKSVSKLVGVVDFSYCITTSSSGSAGASLVGNDSEGREKGKVD
ncbi:hypothetical protein EKO27_g3326 [Xylaria grammica]|uniref:ER transporter 6TM N-terminal domain-containing protein n=1 Tax=Xylaria grammica TaxID=363999 RepID=A0A439DBN5_9PEZI|nr:hypothetical protein EKO27_g3326 [Xylaria grammica]